MYSITLRAIVVLALSLQAAHYAPAISPQVTEHLRQVAQTLPSDGFLRKQLEEGVRGDGVHYQWMDQMKQAGVKRAEFEIRLKWFYGPRSMEIARVMYFTNYEGSELQILDSDRIQYFQASGLEKELERVALARGSHGSWVEDPPRQHPPHLWFMPAAIKVELLDDEWLPILPPLYWDFDTSWTPLVDAVAMGDRFAVKNLLAEGNLKSSDLDKALVWAAAGADPRTVQDILKVGARVNSKDQNGRTAIFAAINNDRIANARVLLDAGADVNVRSTDTGDTPLTGSLYYRGDASDIVNLLLRRGANPNIGNSFGRTPLLLATFGQPISVLEALLQAGANVNAKANNGDTALMAAANYNNADALKMLLKYDADRSIKNDHGETALSIALSQNHREIAALLAR